MNHPILAAPLPQSDAALGDAYLSIQLDAQTPVALPMAQAQEVLVVPAQRLTPMPNMPDGVLGLLNRRSRIFWVVDIAQWLQAQPLDPIAQQYTVVIVRVNAAASPQSPNWLGLAVPKVKGVIRFLPELIQSPLGHFPLHLTPYLRGCVLQKQELLLVLDAEALVQTPLLQSPSVL